MEPFPPALEALDVVGPLAPQPEADPPVDGDEGAGVALRSQQAHEDAEATEGVEQREADGGEHEDPELQATHARLAHNAVQSTCEGLASVSGLI